MMQMVTIVPLHFKIVGEIKILGCSCYSANAVGWDRGGMPSLLRCVQHTAENVQHARVCTVDLVKLVFLRS